jgi:hypothetical protein
VRDCLPSFSQPMGGAHWGLGMRQNGWPAGSA